jgi:hypothetical protein
MKLSTDKHYSRGRGVTSTTGGSGTGPAHKPDSPAGGTGVGGARKPQSPKPAPPTERQSPMGAGQFRQDIDRFVR